MALQGYAETWSNLDWKEPLEFSWFKSQWFFWRESSAFCCRQAVSEPTSQ